MSSRSCWIWLSFLYLDISSDIVISRLLFINFWRLMSSSMSSSLESIEFDRSKRPWVRLLCLARDDNCYCCLAASALSCSSSFSRFSCSMLCCSSLFSPLSFSTSTLRSLIAASLSRSLLVKVAVCVFSSAFDFLSAAFSSFVSYSRSCIFSIVCSWYKERSVPCPISCKKSV